MPNVVTFRSSATVENFDNASSEAHRAANLLRTYLEDLTMHLESIRLDLQHQIGEDCRERPALVLVKSMARDGEAAVEDC